MGEGTIKYFFILSICIGVLIFVIGAIKYLLDKRQKASILKNSFKNSQVFSNSRTKKFIIDRKNLAIIALVIMILFAGLLFYYYIYRPDQIRKKCNQEALGKAKYKTMEGFSQSKYNSYYKECLILNNLPE